MHVYEFTDVSGDCSCGTVNQIVFDVARKDGVTTERSRQVGAQQCDALTTPRQDAMSLLIAAMVFV
jgi:hypothetical protein